MRELVLVLGFAMIAPIVAPVRISLEPVVATKGNTGKGFHL